MKNTSARSEEFEDILGKYPPWILRCGISFCGVFILILLAGSMLFRYPEVVSTPMVVTSTRPIEEIAIKRAGRIMDLYVKNNQEVRSGDYLAVMENTASTTDVIALKNYLSTFTNISQMADTLPPLTWTLGELQTTYLQLYSILRSASHNIATKKEKADILLSELRNKIRIWESDYVLKSNTSGTIVFFNNKTTNHYLSEGIILFKIIPEPSEPLIGKISLSSVQVGKVKVGQKADIYFENTSTQGNIVIKGELIKLSPLPYNGNYIGYVSLSDTTSSHKENFIKIGMQAKADIIINDISLFSRILGKSIKLIQD